MIISDPDGDVVIKLREPSALVSSNALCLSSDVFSTMLKSSFKGVQQLRERSEPKTVSLPEDDREAFLLYCKVIHFQEVPWEPSAKVLAALALVCDKYGFSKAILSWSSVWLRKWTKSTSIEDLSSLLILAYVLDLSEAFGDISQAILLSYAGSFKDLAFSDHVLLKNGLAGKYDQLMMCLKLTLCICRVK